MRTRLVLGVTLGALLLVSLVFGTFGRTGAFAQSFDTSRRWIRFFKKGCRPVLVAHLGITSSKLAVLSLCPE